MEIVEIWRMEWRREELAWEVWRGDIRERQERVIFWVYEDMKTAY